MPRLVLDIGPLIIEETKTRKEGRTVYRLYTRNSTNNTATRNHLKKIARTIIAELMRTGELRPREVRDERYRTNNREKMRESHRRWWAKNADKINAKRRERYALRKNQNGSSL